MNAARLIPLAALAAILFVVAYNMSELRHFGRMVRRAPRADVAILLVTFGLTVFAAYQTLPIQVLTTPASAPNTAIMTRSEVV